MSTNVNGGRPSKSTAEGENSIAPFGKNSPANPPGKSAKRGASANKGAQEGVRDTKK